MTMGKMLQERMAELAPERRARIAAEADRMHAEYRTLQELRKAKDLTQVQLAPRHPTGRSENGCHRSP